ncbi:MAG: cobalamin-dependent protein, partial [Phycisphaeraceae bacterium]|nr:cobalamin-dependent protein [Phycisphaeraceae bacterium]
MKVLLINPPCDPRTIGLQYLAKVEPLALELVGTAVKPGNDVRIVDMMLRPGDLKESLKDFRPDVVGVTSEHVRRNTAIATLRAVRQVVPDCLTVVGGHHPTLVPQDFDDPAVDAVVIGEGVRTFIELCEARKAGQRNLEGIAGLHVRTKDGLIPTAYRPPVRTLDEQPFPDRSLTARYRKHYHYMHEPSVAAVRTSVGCVYPCSFCCCREYTEGKFITRSPHLVVEELKQVQEPFVIFC